MRAGDECLAALHRLEQHALPPLVQLGEHIVEQQHRRFPAQPLDDLQLRELQAQHNRALLPLRAVYAHIAAVEHHHHIVAVRADRGAAAVNIPLRVLKQPLAHRRGQPLGFHPRQVRLVGEQQRFAAAGELEVHIRRDGGQLVQKCRALDRDRRAEPGKLLVPGLEQARAHARFLLEQRVPLLERRVVLLQRVVVRGLELRNLHVEEAAPLRRPALDEHQILRREHHHVQAAEQLARARQRCAVDQQPLPFAGRQLAGDAARAAARVQRQLNGAELLRLPDQLRIARGAVAAAERAQKDGFEHIGLARGVVARQHAKPRVRLQLQPRVIAEIRQLQLRNPHARILPNISGILYHRFFRLPMLEL